MVFEGEEKRQFNEFIDDALIEANYVYGYGRYLRKNARVDSDLKSKAYDNGLEVVKEAKAIKESLRLAKQEITDLDAWWKKTEEEKLPVWSQEDYVAGTVAYVKKRKGLAKKFAGESLRLVWLRKPLESVLKVLDLPTRRKYSRKLEESEDE